MTIKDFTRRVIPIKDRLFRFAMRMVDNAAEAEDVVQEVLIKLWNKREELPAIDNLEAWSIRVTRNLSVDKLRSKHHKMETLKDGFEIVSDAYSPQQLVETKDAMDKIHAMMQALPEKQRMVMQLRDIEEMSYAEIAEILEIPMNQVKVNLFRARQQMKAQLSKKEHYGL